MIASNASNLNSLRLVCDQSKEIQKSTNPIGHGRVMVRVGYLYLMAMRFWAKVRIVYFYFSSLLDKFESLYKLKHNHCIEMHEIQLN